MRSYWGSFEHDWKNFSLFLKVEVKDKNKICCRTTLQDWYGSSRACNACTFLLPWLQSFLSVYENVNDFKFKGKVQPLWKMWKNSIPSPTPLQLSCRTIVLLFSSHHLNLDAPNGNCPPASPHQVDLKITAFNHSNCARKVREKCESGGKSFSTL